MDSKDDSLEKRIMADINSVFQKHRTFSEYGVILIDKPEVNTSPIVVENGVLGLHAWCVKKMLTYSYGILQRHWQSKVINSLRMTACLPVKEVLNHTRLVLLINPECYSAWNERKKFIMSSNLDLQDELSLTRLVLTKHPKSAETFSHRKWLISKDLKEQFENQLTNTHINSTDFNSLTWSTNCPGLDNLIKHEISLCNSSAERYASNYSAWSHRIWFLQKISGLATATMLLIIRDELEIMKAWLYSHVSDHSGYHYRQFLLQTHADINPDSISIVDILTTELDITTDIIKLYPCHEAVWNHRRFVIYNLSKYVMPEEIDDIFDDIEGNDSLEHTPGKRPKVQHCNSGDLLMQRFKHTYTAWKVMHLSGSGRVIHAK